MSETKTLPDKPSTRLKLSKKQAEFLELVADGKSVFLTGKAGTGKSYVVQEAIKSLKLQKKNVVALAPTGVAANNIGGQTVHSMFSLDPFGVLTFEDCRFLKSERRRMMGLIDVIFIDEVSMLRPDHLDAINWTMIKNDCKGLKDIQIIFIGDLKQLPAPIDDNTRSVLFGIYEGHEFYNALICKKLDMAIIELDEVLRQSDPEFIFALNIVREGGRSEYFRQFVTRTPRGIILAPHNSTVQQYNVNGLANLQGDEYVWDAVISGNVKAGDFNLESQVRVKPGCRIMYLVNSQNNNLFNGTLGIFETEDGNFFINVGGVRYALEQIQVTKKEYVLNESQDKLELREIGNISQMPIKLAYALTIHKSQGLTFDEVTLDLTLPCFSKGQMYTALSRVKTPAGLSIITK